MNSTLPQHKYGRCCCPECNGAEVAGRKVKKEFYCLNSYNRMKTVEQMDKAKRKNALRIDMGKVRKLTVVQDKDIANRSAIIGDIDNWMSVYIRLKDANNEGMVKCFCCPTVLHWKDAHNSHYIRRGHMGLRFEVNNCRVSCPSCNNKHNDNVEPYRTLLEADKPGIIEYLEEQQRLVHKYSMDELKGLLIDFREKAKLVKSKLINQ